MTTADRARSALRAALPPLAPSMPHPGDDEIARYHRDELAPPDRERLADHFVACPECTERLLLRADFDATETAEPLSEFELAAAWRAVRPRELEPARGSRWPLRTLAATFLVAALGLGIQARQLRQEIAAAQAPELNTPIVDLFATERRSSVPRPPAPPVSATSARLTLVLNPERRETFPSYELTVRDATGEVLYAASGLEKNAYGSFTVTLPRPLLRPPHLSLTLAGLRGSQRETLGEFTLELADPAGAPGDGP
ncbi:MAG: hypothetical protein SF066_23020 [Thermoanaerobaculia bacterium]|nr:hypothetical protein [Thermoanaerobaculia bacterium]